ncbi:unnamed protein product, partial [Prorocentrum cordatum]
GGPRPQEYDYHLGEAVVRLPEDEARVLRTEMQHAEIFADGEGGEAPWKLLLEFEDAPPAAAAASAPEAAAAPPLPPPARPPAAQDGQPLESRDRVPQHLKDRTTRSSITRVQPRPPRRWRRRGSSPRPTVRRASRPAPPTRACRSATGSAGGPSAELLGEVLPTPAVRRAPWAVPRPDTDVAELAHCSRLDFLLPRTLRNCSAPCRTQ